MKSIKNEIFSSDGFSSLAAVLRRLRQGERGLIHGAAGSLLGFAVALAYEQRRSQVLLLTSSTEEAEKLRDDCALLLGESTVRYLGGRPTHAAELLDVSGSIASVEALKSLLAGADVVVVSSAQAAACRIPRPQEYSRRVLELSVNTPCSYATLITRLTELGFERKDFVEGYGDFSVRGGILDVFPFIGENPVRIEFWGDTIESIREFDVLSQRSIKELQMATIVPDLMAPSADGGAMVNPVTVFEYLKPDALIILDEPEMIRSEIEEVLNADRQSIVPWAELHDRATRFPHIMHTTFRSEADEGSIAEHLIDFSSSPQPSFNGSIKSLAGAIKRYDEDGFRVIIGCDTGEEADRLRELLEEEFLQLSTIPGRDSPAVRYDILDETVHAGFVFPAAKLAFFTEHQIFGRIKRRGMGRKRRFKGFSQKDLQQLRKGDYVVHVDFGIGQFDGLKKITVRGCEQEVMKILYLGNDVLYVNLNYIDRVQKYASREGHLPKLTKLGAPDWDRLKAKAKLRIKDIARDLIRLYAVRKHEQGVAFSPDTHWQKELEASFMYEDTADQARATAEVKRDMESPAPMDRLICGDVGFGKTEVAVRAAFKAVLDGKQVAMLVPTTILAHQHFNTFNDRLNRYSVCVECISRFTSKKQQQRILDGLAAGSVDVLIGTHRMLSNDVRFKDLGLLIIDEEHRFGVAAKEKLRKLKTSVDTLTLTATPIPRTLHFSLMGARDISLIATPPRNRLPVVTEIVQFDWRIIREAILRELHRGGQIYFVHDRVEKIEEMKDLLQEHVPEARYAVAHGQMRGHSLEKVMIDFLEKQYDVLVCTKIIESGIDIPSVNTIIINRADHFGMAELYQLRGRVGRSNVQAYAYLLTPPIAVLPKSTLRRLQAIEEFVELGSGFNLAMRDLEIRGAGNLLGAEQSGFVVEMGYEMYERIVSEAVEELKEEEFKDLFQVPVDATPRKETAHPIVEFDVDAYLPDFYVESDRERLEIYRRLSRIDHLQQVNDLRAELRDRFGEYPPEVENLFVLVEFRLIATQMGMTRLALEGTSVFLTLPDHNSFFHSENGNDAPLQKLLAAVSSLHDVRYKLQQESHRTTGSAAPVVLALHGSRVGEERLLWAKHVLETLAASFLDSGEHARIEL